MHESYKIKIDGEIPNPRPQVFTLNIEEHVPTIPGVNPKDYFVTSGDAVAKAKALYKALISSTEPGSKEAAVAAQRLIDLLIRIRGNDIFLETEHIDHVLHIIPKNPRNRE